MSETISLLLAFIGGLLLGGFFFGGLWWTVQKGLASPRPALWFLVSYIVRMAVATTGFYALSDGHWSRLAACLLGFVIARLFITRFEGKIKPVTLSQEAGHAAESR